MQALASYEMDEDKEGKSMERVNSLTGMHRLKGEKDGLGRDGDE